MFNNMRKIVTQFLFALQLGYGNAILLFSRTKTDKMAHDRNENRNDFV